MKSQVSEVLNDVFAEIAKNPHVQRKITEFLYENHKIPHGTFQEIVVNNERFFNLSEIEQVVVVNAIYQITNFDQIEPTKFYTNKEIKATENYILQKIESSCLTHLKVYSKQGRMITLLL